MVTSTPTATQIPIIRPQIYKEDDVEVVQGALKNPDLKTSYNSADQTMSLKGHVNFTPFENEAPFEFDLDLFGSSELPGTITMRPTPSAKLPQGMKIAAKATCIGEDETSCDDSFIDIYFSYNKRVYHHQIEVLSEKTKKIQSENKKTDYATSVGAEEDDDDTEDVDSPRVIDVTAPKNSGVKKGLPLVRLDHENEPIEEDDDVEGETGRYIGDLKGDIHNILYAEPKDAIGPAVPAIAPVAPVKPVDNKGQKTDEKKTEEKAPTPKTPESKIDDKKPEPAKKTEPLTPKAEVKPGPAKSEVTPKPSETSQAPTPEEKPAEKEETSQPVKNEIDITKKIMQVIGFANSGRLKKALNLYDYSQKHQPVGYYIARPEIEIHYGGNELAYLIIKIGKFALTHIDDYSVRIGDLSKKNGGTIYTKYKGVPIPKHLSHKNGLDADMSYFFKDPKDQGQSALHKGSARSDWMIELQWKLFKELVSTNLVDRFFVHRNVKKALCRYARKNEEISKDTRTGLAYETLWRLQPRPADHADHFHIRAKCSSLQQGCRPSPEPTPGTGCF